VEEAEAVVELGLTSLNNYLIPLNQLLEIESLERQGQLLTRNKERFKVLELQELLRLQLNPQLLPFQDSM
jgi:hypothetical protein